MIAVQEKKCIGPCGRTLVVEEFPVQMSTARGPRRYARCRDCHNLRQRENYTAGGEQRREYQRDYRNTRRDHYVQLQRESYQRNRVKRCADNRAKIGFNTRQSWLRRLKKLGVTEDRYQKLFAAQDGRCAICSRREEGKFAKLCADHCHESGKFRGLLCNRCNQALGLMGDSILALQAAIRYLEDAR